MDPITCLQETYLLRHIMSADVEGSCAGFFADAAPAGLDDEEDGAAGMLGSLAAAAASGCWLFFLRPILIQKVVSVRMQLLKLL